MAKKFGTLASFIFVRQPVLEKENFAFNRTVLHLNVDLVPQPARRKRLVKYILEISSGGVS